jgi:hypothetical protein
VLIRDSLGGRAEGRTAVCLAVPNQLRGASEHKRTGVATVEILRTNETNGLVEVVSVAVVGISTSAPALFTAASTGYGLASALSAHDDGQGTLTYSPVAMFDSSKWTVDTKPD